MFSRKSDSEEGAKPTPEDSEGVEDKVPVLNPGTLRRTEMAKSDSRAPTQFRPEISRRVTEIPGAPRAALGALDNDDTKKLIVGREIQLSGEITACEKLIVEGRVEANLTDSDVIEIAASGYFKGSGEVEEAIVSGEFHGTLKVRGRLFVRATGKVSGEIRYGELEVEQGGRISGSIDQLEPDEAASEQDGPESPVAAEGD